MSDSDSAVAVLDVETEEEVDGSENGTGKKKRKPDPEAAARREEIDKSIRENAAVSQDEEGNDVLEYEDIDVAKDLARNRLKFKRSDFSVETLPIFFEMRAIQCDNKAEDFRLRAEEARNPDETKKSLGKLKRMAKKAAELADSLKASGVDVSDLKSLLAGLM